MAKSQLELLEFNASQGFEREEISVWVLNEFLTIRSCREMYRKPEVVRKERACVRPRPIAVFQQRSLDFREG